MVTLDRLGEVARMSPYHLQRTFKRLIGVRHKAYSNAQRLGVKVGAGQLVQ